jgi:hypothetical protein
MTRIKGVSLHFAMFELPGMNIHSEKFLLSGSAAGQLQKGMLTPCLELGSFTGSNSASCPGDDLDPRICRCVRRRDGFGRVIFDVYRRGI